MSDNRHFRTGQVGSTGQIVLVAALVFILVIAAGFGAWRWQQQEIDRLNERIGQLEDEKSADVNRLNDRIVQLEKDLAAAREQLEQQPPEQPPVSNEYTSPKGVFILVDTPLQNATVKSPLRVSGKVPGTWSFEADFPVQLKDSQGNVLAEGPARLLGDWMTEELVPFEVILTFTSPGSGSGTLVLQKDNPSGMPENDDSLSIPINF